jgi:hypothetical protein
MPQNYSSPRGRKEHGGDYPQIAQIYADSAFGFWSFLRYSKFALRHLRPSGNPWLAHKLRIEKKKQGVEAPDFLRSCFPY